MKKAVVTLLVLTLVMFSGTFLLGACGGGGGGGSAGEPIVLVSQSTAGEAGTNSSEGAGVSADGRYVVFTCNAPNLVAGDTNSDYDVFVRDVQMGITSRESVSTAGSEGFGTGGSNASYTYSPAISDDGYIIAFQGEPVNLVPDDTNDTYDVFVRDTQTPLTTRASVSSAGTEGDQGGQYPAISGDGRWVAFQSNSENLVADDTTFYWDIFLHDTQTPLTTRVSLGVADTQANNSSYEPSVSGDGRYVAFQSFASNLVAGDTNGRVDIFVRDTLSSITSLISVSTAGSQHSGSCDPPTISADGRYVAFASDADNLVTDDINGSSDIFVRDRVMNETTRVSVSTAGAEADDDCYNPSISADGRFVAFDSDADSLVPGTLSGYSDIYVHDRQTGITSRVSVNAAGAQANGDSYYPYISGDGLYVVFESEADNLVSTPADLGPPGTRHIYRAPVPR